MDTGSHDSAQRLALRKLQPKLRALCLRYRLKPKRRAKLHDEHDEHHEPCKAPEYNKHCLARWAARRKIVIEAVVGGSHRQHKSVGRGGLLTGRDYRDFYRGHDTEKTVRCSQDKTIDEMQDQH